MLPLINNMGQILLVACNHTKEVVLWDIQIMGLGQLAKGLIIWPFKMQVHKDTAIIIRLDKSIAVKLEIICPVTLWMVIDSKLLMLGNPHLFVLQDQGLIPSLQIGYLITYLFGAPKFKIATYGQLIWITTCRFHLLQLRTFLKKGCETDCKTSQQISHQWDDV